MPDQFTDQDIREQVQRASRALRGRTIPTTVESSPLINPNVIGTGQGPRGPQPLIGNRQPASSGGLLTPPRSGTPAPQAPGSQSQLPLGQLDFGGGVQQPTFQPQPLSLPEPIGLQQPQGIAPFQNPIQGIIDQAGQRPPSTAPQPNIAPLALPPEGGPQFGNTGGNSFSQFGIANTAGVNPLASSGGQAFSQQNNIAAQGRLNDLLGRARQVDLDNAAAGNAQREQLLQNTGRAAAQRAATLRAQAEGITDPRARAGFLAQAASAEALSTSVNEQLGGLQALSLQREQEAIRFGDQQLQNRQGRTATREQASLAGQQSARDSRLRIGEQQQTSILNEQSAQADFARQQLAAESTFDRDVELLGIQSGLDRETKIAVASLKLSADTAQSQGDNTPALTDGLTYYDAIPGDRFNQLVELQSTSALLPEQATELQTLQKEREDFNKALDAGFPPSTILDELFRRRSLGGAEN